MNDLPRLALLLDIHCTPGKTGGLLFASLHAPYHSDHHQWQWRDLLWAGGPLDHPILPPLWDTTTFPLRTFYCWDFFSSLLFRGTLRQTILGLLDFRFGLVPHCEENTCPSPGSGGGDSGTFNPYVPSCVSFPSPFPFICALPYHHLPFFQAVLPFPWCLTLYELFFLYLPVEIDTQPAGSWNLKMENRHLEEQAQHSAQVSRHATDMPRHPKTICLWYCVFVDFGSCSGGALPCACGMDSPMWQQCPVDPRQAGLGRHLPPPTMTPPQAVRGMCRVWQTCRPFPHS